MLTAARGFILSLAVMALLLLPPAAHAQRMTVVLSDVTGGEAEGKATVAQGWLSLKLTGLPPETDLLIELVGASGAASRSLGRVTTREGGRARLTVDLQDADLAPGTAILVRPVTEGIPREVVLQGRVP